MINRYINIYDKIRIDMFEKDLKRVLEEYKGYVITDKLIEKIVSDYKELFTCPSWVDDIDKYYKD